MQVDMIYKKTFWNFFKTLSTFILFDLTTYDSRSLSTFWIFHLCIFKFSFKCLKVNSFYLNTTSQTPLKEYLMLDLFLRSKILYLFAHCSKVKLSHPFLFSFNYSYWIFKTVTVGSGSVYQLSPKSQAPFEWKRVLILIQIIIVFSFRYLISRPLNIHV